MRELAWIMIVALASALLLGPAAGVAEAQEKRQEPSRSDSPEPRTQPPPREPDTAREPNSPSPGPAVSTGMLITFPVFGDHQYSDDFGASRPGGRRHQGIDIFAAKLTPVVAVMDGKIAWINDAGKECCSIGIEHAGGWVTKYIHLNNDSHGTDDGAGFGISPELRVGSVVKAGQLVGYVGDSGNAEDTSPHLHFELHAGREVVNPYPFLKAGVLGPVSAQGDLARTGFARDSFSIFAFVLLGGGAVSLLVAQRVSVGLGRHKKRMGRSASESLSFLLRDVHLW